MARDFMTQAVVTLVTLVVVTQLANNFAMVGNLFRRIDNPNRRIAL
jgi:hypothetical protein